MKTIVLRIVDALDSLLKKSVGGPFSVRQLSACPRLASFFSYFRARRIAGHPDIAPRAVKNRVFHQPVNTKALPVFLFCCLALPAAAFGGGTGALLLPWVYQVEDFSNGPHPVLPGAATVEQAVLRTTTPVDDRADALVLYYRHGSYPGAAVAGADFDRLQPLLGADGEWDVVLLAGDGVYWLNAACPLTAERFSEVYAGLVDTAEQEGPAVNYALLCACDSDCTRVAVDR